MPLEHPVPAPARPAARRTVGPRSRLWGAATVEPPGEAGLIDAKRLAASRSLAVRALNDGRYLVEGSAHPYVVRVGHHPLCLCMDATFRARFCKHLLAAMRVDGDPRLPASERGGTARSLPALGHGDRALGLHQPVTALRAELLARYSAVPGASETLALLAAALLTHPRATVADARYVAETAPVEYLQLALTRVEVAMRDALLRQHLAAAAATPVVLRRLLPHAEGLEFRLLFKRLVALDQMTLLIEALADPRTEPKGALHQLDILPFLDHTQPAHVREKAFMALQHVGADVPVEVPAPKSTLPRRAGGR